VLAGELDGIWATGDIAVVTSGVIETGAVSLIVAAGLDSVGSADIGARLSPPQEAAKAVQSTTIAARIKCEGLNFHFLSSRSIVYYFQARQHIFRSCFRTNDMLRSRC
jgi:hypothetical protein